MAVPTTPSRAISGTDRSGGDRTGADRSGGDRGGRSRGRGERLGWLGVATMTAAVAATWAPRLTIPLGDSHAGRVDSRYALHLRNLREDGLSGSTWGADWEPYVATPYAHHPPLRNVLDALFSLLPGDGLHEIRIAPFLLALLTIPAAAALLRGLGLRWTSTLLALGLLVATALFWVYAPLRYDLGVITAFSALVVHLRQREHPPRWMVAAACVTALLATLLSWPGIAFTGTLLLWLGYRRQQRPPAIAAGACAVLGTAVSLGYVLGIHGFGRMAEQVELRTGTTGFTLGDFLGRLGQHLTDLLPVWYLALLPVAVAAGLWDRRTRAYTALTTALTAGWVLVLNNGAFIHDYWMFPLLLPGLAGMAVLVDRFIDQLSLPAAAVRLGTVALTVALAGALAVIVFGGTAQRYVYQPTDVAGLIVQNPPPQGQEYAWYGRFDPPRWLAYYWGLPPLPATPEVLAEDARPNDLVLVHLDALPDWWPASAEPVAQEGSYALFRASDVLS